MSYDAEPLSARQAIIGTRARQREPPLSDAPNTAKPLSARAVRIGAHDPERCHYRHAKPLSAHVIRSASPRRREKPLSALGQSTLRHHRRGSHYRRPYSDDAQRRPARDATIGTCGNDVLGGHGGSSVARKNPPVKTPIRPEPVRPRGPPPDGRRMVTGPVGIAYASQRGATIGMRSLYRHTCHMTPSHYRRVKPLSAHVRDDASPHWCPPQPRRSHYRHAQSGSKDATGHHCPGKGENYSPQPYDRSRSGL